MSTSVDIKSMIDKIDDLAKKYQITTPDDAERTRIYGIIQTFVDNVMKPGSPSLSSSSRVSSNSTSTAFDKFNGKLTEKQQSKTLGCGRHTLNNLFGHVYFTKGKEDEKDHEYTLDTIKTITENLINTGNRTIDLSKMCEFLLKHPLHGLSSTSEMQEQAGEQLQMMNCQDNEEYDISVLTNTLQFLGYEPEINLNSKGLDDVKYSDINDDNKILGVIVNPGGHWFVIRKYNDKLYKVDSLNDAIEITKLDDKINGSVYPIANYSIYTRMHCFVKFKMHDIMNALRPITDPEELKTQTQEEKDTISRKNQDIEGILSWLDELKAGIEDDKNAALNILYANLEKINITDRLIHHVASLIDDSNESSENIAKIIIENEGEGVGERHMLNTYIVKPADGNEPYYITFDSINSMGDGWEQQQGKDYWVKQFINGSENNDLPEPGNVFTDTNENKYLVISNNEIDEKLSEWVRDNNGDGGYEWTSDDGRNESYQIPRRRGQQSPFNRQQSDDSLLLGDEYADDDSVLGFSPDEDEGQFGDNDGVATPEGARKKDNENKMGGGNSRRRKSKKRRFQTLKNKKR